MDHEIREVAGTAQAEPPAALATESRDFYENALRQARQQVETERAALGLEEAPRYPTLKEQATAAGLAMAYARLYRIESQSGAHPMVMAIDELLVEEDDGVLVLSEPRSNPRSYGTAAIALMESLQLAKRLLPDLPLDGLDEVSDEIERSSHLARNEMRTAYAAGLVEPRRMSSGVRPNSCPSAQKM